MRKFLIFRRFFSLLLLVAFSAIAFIYGRNIPFKEQWPLYDSLRNTASIVFAVMGAWIALLYPEALSTLFKVGKIQGDFVRVRQINKLLLPLIYSTFVLSSILVVGIAAPILKQIPILSTKYVLWIRGLSYLFLSVLTVFQLWSVILTLVPADFVKRNLENVSETHSRKHNLMSQAKELKPDDKKPNNV